MNCHFFRGILRNLSGKIILILKYEDIIVLNSFTSSLKKPKFLTKKDNYIYLILILSLGLRLGAFISFAPWDENIVSGKLLLTDGASYQNMALGMMEGYDNGETFWAPGFPAFLAAVYSIFGVKPWVVLFLNCFISTFSVVLLYQITKKLFTEKIALFSTLLLAIEPHQIVYTQTLFSENLFIPLLLLFFLFFLRYLTEHKQLLLAVAAVFLGLSMYFRPAANFLFIPVVISIFLYLKVTWSEKTKSVLLFLFFLLITLSPWLIRNYKLHDHFGLSTNGGYNLLYIFVGSIYNNQYQMHPDSTHKMLQDKVKDAGDSEINNPFILDKTEKRVAFELIQEEPLKFIQNYLSGCVNIYTSLSSYQISSILGLEGSYVLGKNFYGVSQLSQIDYFLKERKIGTLIASGSVLIFLIFSYLMVVAGIWRLYKDGKIMEMVMLLGVIIYFTLIVGTLGSSARFKLPITPFYLVLAAYGINRLISRTGKFNV